MDNWKPSKCIICGDDLRWDEHVTHIIHYALVHSECVRTVVEAYLSDDDEGEDDGTT